MIRRIFRAIGEHLESVGRDLNHDLYCDENCKMHRKPYCAPASHTWVAVVDDDPTWSTLVCVKCQCHQGTRVADDA